MSIETVIARIQRMRAMSDPNSPEVKMAFTRIGVRLKAEIKNNLRTNSPRQIGRTGLLIDSINWVIKGNTLEVGSYGVPYARINEYGGPMSKSQVGAMFYYMRKYQGKGPKGVGKGVVQIFGDRTGYYKERPYLRPAFKDNVQFIIDTMREIGRTK